MINPYITAEACKNHFGETKKAKKMIKTAKEYGFNAIKFQAYNKEDINKDHMNYNRYVECHLGTNYLEHLSDYCEMVGIDFYCSVFSYSLIDELSKFMKQIKIPSTFFKHEPFVKEAIKRYKTVHVSTGMNSMKDILLYIDKYNKYNTFGTNIIYYNCTSEYPTLSNNIHLNRNNKFIQGFSDHSIGVFAMVVASIMGVKYIEKHFSIDSDCKSWDVTPGLMARYNEMIRNVNDYFIDNGVTEGEVKNYDFYKKEFKDLCFLI